jgi:hypothetical protein
MLVAESRHWLTEGPFYQAGGLRAIHGTLVENGCQEVEDPNPAIQRCKTLLSIKGTTAGQLHMHLATAEA